MDKALDGTGHHMQMGTAKSAITLGPSGLPSVKQAADSPHNVGKNILTAFEFLNYHLLSVHFHCYGSLI